MERGGLTRLLLGDGTEVVVGPGAGVEAPRAGRAEEGRGRWSQEESVARRLVRVLRHEDMEDRLPGGSVPARVLAKRLRVPTDAILWALADDETRFGGEWAPGGEINVWARSGCTFDGGRKPRSHGELAMQIGPARGGPTRGTHINWLAHQRAKRRKEAASSGAGARVEGAAGQAVPEEEEVEVVAVDGPHTPVLEDETWGTWRPEMAEADEGLRVEAVAGPSGRGSARPEGPEPGELEDFVARNRVDGKAAAALARASRKLQRLVMRRDLHSARNPSSALMCRLREGARAVEL